LIFTQLTLKKKIFLEVTESFYACDDCLTVAVHWLGASIIYIHFHFVAQRSW